MLPSPVGTRRPTCKTLPAWCALSRWESRGPLPSAKHCDNARQRAKRTEEFFEFCQHRYGPHFFDTMSPADVLILFLTELYSRNLKVTTVRHYLIYIRIFCSYAVDSSEKHASVNEAKLRHLKRACLYQMKQIRGEVQALRTDTRAEKLAVIISRESLCKFLRSSHGKIPRLIELFAREQTFGILLLLQGMLSGYMSVMSGHRRCVLINMKADEVNPVSDEMGSINVLVVNAAHAPVRQEPRHRPVKPPPPASFDGVGFSANLTPPVLSGQNVRKQESPSGQHPEHLRQISFHFHQEMVAVAAPLAQAVPTKVNHQDVWIRIPGPQGAQCWEKIILSAIPGDAAAKTQVPFQMIITEVRLQFTDVRAAQNPDVRCTLLSHLCNSVWELGFGCIYDPLFHTAPSDVWQDNMAHYDSSSDRAGICIA
ncbi:hypothetical protein IRJ41_008163 [Triplophysa rosa]|uniref:Uncharacterized protein n=1 Tax=Triplophysa rosa TaxID=992332 RepID=A0A9W7T5F3_TRIRA|nr:hypothetical protein IRJ41_008163 [Triplophysa rosa]